MKLLRIHTRNLNSLYGEHDVDLAGSLGTAPIFLIMGPTGAGKSTLMDAIALALFGQTPRLKLAKTESEPDLDCRNVMSRGTGEALAEVTVSKVEDGRPVRYRATWYCHRARKKADGAFQDPVRALARAEGSGEFVTLVESKQAKVWGPEFEKFLEGMTVQDFTRSMLLAQGEFSAFLKANEDERSAILERLTNTSVYRDLGARAADRKRAAEAALKTAEEAVGNVALLSEAEEAALRSQLKELRPRREALQAEGAELAGFEAWCIRESELGDGLSQAKLRLEQALADGVAQRPELDRLAEHERCAVAFPALQKLTFIRGERSKVLAAIPAAEEEVAVLTERVAEGATAEQNAAEAVQSHQGRAEALAPQIAAARKLRTELQAAKVERDRANQAVTQRSEELRRAEDDLRTSEAERSRATAALTSAEAACAAVSGSRPLVELLAGLRAREQALKSQRAGIAERKTRCDTDAKALANGKAELATLRQKREAAVSSATRLQADAAEASSRLAQRLAGAVDSASRRKALQQSRTEATSRMQQVDGLLRDVALASSTKTTIASLEAEQARVGQVLLDAAAQAARRREEIGGVDAEVLRKQTELQDLRVLQSLALHRIRLQDGAECPLCGATEHPYREDARHAELDARVEQRCRALETELEDGRKRLDALRREQADASTREAVAQSRVTTLAADLERARAVLAEQLARVDGRDEAALRAERERDSEAIAKIDRHLDALQEAESSERRASEALLAGQSAVQQLEARISAGESWVADRESRLAQSVRDLEVENERASEDERALLAELARCGVGIDAGLAAAMSVAARQVEAVRAADRALETAKAEAQKAVNEAEGAAIRTQAARQTTTTAEAEVRDRTQVVERLEPEVAASLGGKTPDEIEAELSSERTAAAHRHAQATEQLSKLTQRLSAARASCDALHRQRAELDKDEEEFRQLLEMKLRTLRLSSEQELHSRLLPEEEAASAVALRTRLDAAEQSCRRVLEERTRDRDKHLENRPPMREAWSTLGIEGLRALRAELGAEADAQVRQEATLVEKLAQQDRARAQVQQKQAALERARAEFDNWERLHRLIGVTDGKAFQRYAQTLNLAELIGRANHHLERLAPRYSLVGARTVEGEPRLAFAIRDAYQADEIRPINTLSGGETFLVSLSLALGLAGYRTVKMPIETLLLDEGFGTLDPETLQVAMAALETLHATGTQVGIISHVEALKERIPARVIVERTGAGRSTVRVEAA